MNAEQEVRQTCNRAAEEHLDRAVNELNQARGLLVGYAYWMRWPVESLQAMVRALSTQVSVERENDRLNLRMRVPDDALQKLVRDLEARSQAAQEAARNESDPVRKAGLEGDGNSSVYAADMVRALLDHQSLTDG